MSVLLQWGRNLSVAEGGLWHNTCTDLIASMGPQPFGCGRDITAGDVVQIGALQWGRNLSVAEGEDAVAKATADLGFNGAATFRLRKARSFRPSQNRDARASMGPQPFGCGRAAAAAAAD